MRLLFWVFANSSSLLRLWFARVALQCLLQCVARTNSSPLFAGVSQHVGTSCGNGLSPALLPPPPIAALFLSPCLFSGWPTAKPGIFLEPCVFTLEPLPGNKCKGRRVASPWRGGNRQHPQSSPARGSKQGKMEEKGLRFIGLFQKSDTLGVALGVAVGQESLPQLAPIFTSTCIGTTSGAASHMSFEICAIIFLFPTLKQSSS